MCEGEGLIQGESHLVGGDAGDSARLCLALAVLVARRGDDDKVARLPGDGDGQGDGGVAGIGRGC